MPDNCNTDDLMPDDKEQVPAEIPEMETHELPPDDELVDDSKTKLTEEPEFVHVVVPEEKANGFDYDFSKTDHAEGEMSLSEEEELETTELVDEYTEMPLTHTVYGTREELNTKIKSITETDTKDVDIPNTPTYTIAWLDSAPSMVTSSSTMTEFLTKRKLVPSTSKLLTSKQWNGGSVVSGSTAVAAFAMTNKGVLQLKLYNSGFWVLLRPLSAEEQYLVYQAADIRLAEVGRVLGELDHLLYDAIFQETVLKLLPSITVGSNLAQYETGTVLVDAISALDYQPITTGIVAMLLDRKLKTATDCLKCAYHGDITYNLGLFHGHVSLSLELSDWMQKHDTAVTRKELKEYRLMLLEEIDERMITFGSLRIELDIPQLPVTVMQKTDMVGKLNDQFVGGVSRRDPQVINEVVLQYTTNFLPWIKRLTQLDENGKTILTVIDKAQFTKILSIITTRQEMDKLKKEIETFMLIAHRSVVGYEPATCPKCGHSNTTDKFVVWDGAQLFFNVVCRGLTLKGITLLD